MYLKGQCSQTDELPCYVPLSHLLEVLSEPKADVEMIHSYCQGWPSQPPREVESYNGCRHFRPKPQVQAEVEIFGVAWLSI